MDVIKNYLKSTKSVKINEMKTKKKCLKWVFSLKILPKQKNVCAKNRKKRNNEI